MPAIKVEKTVKLDKFEIVKYQLIHHCFVKNIELNYTELNCLTLLGQLGKLRLTEFIKIAAEKGILGTEVGVRNCLSALKDLKLFVQEGKGKKVIYLNPEMQIRSEGTIILDFKLYHIEANATESTIQSNRRETQPA